MIEERKKLMEMIEEAVKEFKELREEDDKSQLKSLESLTADGLRGYLWAVENGILEIKERIKDK